MEFRVQGSRVDVAACVLTDMAIGITCLNPKTQNPNPSFDAYVDLGSSKEPSPDKLEVGAGGGQK